MDSLGSFVRDLTGLALALTLLIVVFRTTKRKR